MHANFPSPTNQKFKLALTHLDNHLALSGRALSTRLSYCHSFYKLLTNMKRLPEECSKDEIINYYITLKKARNVKCSTIKIHITALKYYLKHIVERVDLYRQIPIPNIKKYNVDILNVKEIDGMFKACKNSRELLIIQLLYETGIRVRELTRLDFHNFDFYNKTITIRDSKNRKTRTVYFGNSLMNTIIAYQEEYKSLFSDTLFTRQFHPFMPISRKGVSWVLKALAKRADIKKRVNPHSLRHAFAVHYLNFGGTIYQLQKLLGHYSLLTTLHYLQYAVLPESRNISILDKTLNLCATYTNIPNSLRTVSQCN